METAERRMAILKLLCRRRHETISNLAEQFGVSERTVRRDIEILSLSEPIYTQTGRYGGGVYVTDNFTMDRMYFKDDEIEVMNKILGCVEKGTECNLLNEEVRLLKKIVKEYTKPSLKTERKNKI
mgnify:CR=1 FL=1